MNFNTPEFFIFLVSVLIFLNFLRKARFQQALLLAASYLFYWFTSSYFVLLLFFITLISYKSGEVIHAEIHDARRKAELAAAIVLLLIPLGFYKYYNFGVEILDLIPLPLNSYLNLPFLDLILPIGISFFTFSAISYVFDIYRGTIRPEENFYRFALFISYFPHLLAGPIVRAGQFLPQLRESVCLSGLALKTGVTLMLWGFVKKFVFADNIAPIVEAIFSHPTNFNSIYIITGTILFGLQIYFDFSGYVDIALGVADMIGLHLPQNFFRPYFSRNPTEFWRRWNITLSRFIRDYVYISLGGNRKGRVRTYLNLEASMLISGLWHGAAWNFVLWGAYHGLLLGVHKFIAKKPVSRWSASSYIHPDVVLLGKILVTQYFVFLGWIMFRVGNLPDMIYCIGKYLLFDFNFSETDTIGQPGFDSLMAFLFFGGTGLYYLAVVLAISVMVVVYWKRGRDLIFMYLSTDWVRYLGSLPLRYWALYVTIMVFILLCFTAPETPEFIYYQF